MTYSIPFYDGTGTLMGVVGIDFTLGAAAQVMAHDAGFCTLKLPSNEIRLVSEKSASY